MQGAGLATISCHEEGMIESRIREIIIALGAMSLLGGAVYLWQAQFDAELPVQTPARGLPAGDGNGAMPEDARDGSAAQGEPGRARPAGSPGGWLSDRDYPAEAIANGWEGSAAFSLTVGRTGRVERCTIIESAGHAVLDEATCAALTRSARFHPARNAAGEAVADSYKGRVTWRMPI
jgi:TonB family protein